MNDSSAKKLVLEPLKISCTSTDCGNGLHCFLQKRRTAQRHGPCRSCGTDLVDWSRVHARDLADVLHTFEALRSERIRHHFWHVELSQHAVNYALRKGKSGIREAAAARVITALVNVNPNYDGRQTPGEGSKNPLHYAQHATACCCRHCLEEWHGIPRERTLTDSEVAYCATLMAMFVEERVPDLQDAPLKVPPLKKTKPPEEKP